MIFDTITHWLGAHAAKQPLEYAETDDEVTLDIHSLTQVDSYSCGAVAGAMVVKTFYPEVRFKDFYKAVNPYPDGVTTTKLVRALRDFNVGCRIMRSLTFKGIREAIDGGCPVIVNILCSSDVDHFMVIYGYNPDPKQVFISPDNGWSRKRMAWSRFKNRTAQVDGRGIVCWGYE